MRQFYCIFLPFTILPVDENLSLTRTGGKALTDHYRSEVARYFCRHVHFGVRASSAIYKQQGHAHNTRIATVTLAATLQDISSLVTNRRGRVTSPIVTRGVRPLSADQQC